MQISERSSGGSVRTHDASHPAAENTMQASTGLTRETTMEVGSVLGMCF